MRTAQIFPSLLLLLALPACEPEDTPGGKLTGIRLELPGKNPGPQGRYILLVEELSPLKATGEYDNGREEDITMSLFWQMQPPGYALIECQQDDLAGNRVILKGAEPGTLEVSAFTREAEDSCIPCAPTPDGGWSFPDAGSGWPMQSEPLVIEVR
jgi:hypothetical protein